MKNKIRGKEWLLLVGLLAVGMLAGCGETPSGTSSFTDEKDKADAVIEEETAEEDDRSPKNQDQAEQNDSLEEETEEAKTDKLITMADLLYESGIIDTAQQPETVLWFNATYAALTYSNGWDWHLVSGLEPTEDNIKLQKVLLQSSWSVKDRESALETVESLITNGHRGKCQKCLDELETLGLLELDEENFIEELMEADLESDPARYVIAYYMYVDGIEPEYIAAFDLCRVNQLYADYYLCGYMDYEEAMDASLENSLILQKMYDSWEEMMDAYLLGFQFWKGDLAITEDSPTLERYHYYEMLCDLEDNPYSLDWNMELKKEW